MDKVFRIEELRPIRDGMTVSRDSKMGERNRATFFSLGGGTSISQECYDRVTAYLGACGEAEFFVGETRHKHVMREGTILLIPENTLCGMQSKSGFVYTELLFQKEDMMNKCISANEVFELKKLISYEEGSISNLDVASNSTMKYVLMAFDEGTGLTPHRAPGNAIVFALEGNAIIGYEGVDYEIKEGECFHFEKNGLHSITAQGRFKMALLLVLE